MEDLPAELSGGDAFSAERRPMRKRIDALVCLNFKVSLRVRQQFKICAARHNMTMTELLLQLLDDRLSSEANASTPAKKARKEIKK